MIFLMQLLFDKCGISKLLIEFKFLLDDCLIPVSGTSFSFSDLSPQIIPEKIFEPASPAISACNILSIRANSSAMLTLSTDDDILIASDNTVEDGEASM